MKKIFCILFTLMAACAGAQSTATSTDLVPDYTWADDNHRDWCDKGIGTAFLAYNGYLHVFNYQGNGTRKGGHAYMYQINEHNTTNLADVNLDDYKVGPSADHDNRIEFNFPSEGCSYDEGAVLGRAFTFTYAGTAWFFMHIRSADQGEHDPDPANESYECYAELPADVNKKCFTYYSTIKPVSTVLKQGGFQFDSLMYFFAWDKSTSTPHWVIQEYSYSTTTGKFGRTGNDIVPTLPAQLPYLGGLLTRVDTSGNNYIVATFYDQLGNVQFGKFLPGLSTSNKRTFTWSSLIGSATSPFANPTGGSALSAGSIRAKRGANDMTNKSSGDRVILWGESQLKYSDGTYHVWYIEYRVENDQFIQQASGNIAVPTNNGPHLVSNNYHLYASYQLFPKDNTTYLDGVDGFDQYVWIVYPDENRHFHGCMFESDKWQMLPQETVDSPDMDNDDPVNGYKGISSLWTLSAILDGPPPVSMDWETWDRIYVVPHPPTEITLTSEKSVGTEFMNSSENEWSIGEKIKMTSIRDHEYKGNSESFKYSAAWESSTTTSNDTTVTYEQPIELYEDFQDYGKLLYLVPQMKRFSYSLYPWWDFNTQEYPVPGSFQYLFHTYNMFPKLVNKPLNSFPFNVAEPNGSNLNSWKLDARPQLDSAITVYGLRSCLHLAWYNGNCGNHGEISVAQDTVTVNSMTNSWDFEVEAGVATIKIPKVCEMEVYLSTGYSGTLKNETTTTTKYNHCISASIVNLYSSAEGIKLTSLSMDAFFLAPEKHHWWYLDSCAGQTPWYLAWVVNTAYQSLDNVSPANQALYDTTGTIFSWRPNEGTLYDYELFISKNSWVEGYNSVYRRKLGDATEVSVTDFRPEPGVTYYWSVRAYDANHELIWSPIWKFTTPKVAEDPGPGGTPAIKTVVCSNPGSKSELRILVDPPVDGPISLVLRNLDGIEVYRLTLTGTKDQVIPFSLAGASLEPGLYFAEIRTGGERIIKKIVIQ